MKIRTRVAEGEDPTPKELSSQQRVDWNRYVDWLDKKGYKGSTLLDKKATGLARSLFDQFKKENPTASVDYDTVKSVQYEMQGLKNTAQDFAARRNDPNAKNIMTGISKLDGWPGSKTTSFKFPEMTEKNYRNDLLVSHKNLGLVNPKLQPSGLAAFKVPIPKGVTLEQLYDSTGKPSGKGYKDPKSGDVVIVE